MTKYTVEAGSGWRATLDGKQVLYVQEADDEKGYVLAPLVDAEGKPIFDCAREDYAIVRREGKVAVRTAALGAKERAAVAQDNPFRVEKARDGELATGWDNPLLPRSGFRNGAAEGLTMDWRPFFDPDGVAMLDFEHPFEVWTPDQTNVRLRRANDGSWHVFAYKSGGPVLWCELPPLPVGYEGQKG